jgi:hypothetical protein
LTREIHCVRRVGKDTLDLTTCLTHRFSRVALAICFCATIAIFAGKASAQTADTEDRAQLLANPPGFHPGRNVSEEGADEGTTSDNDSDLGTQEILRRAPVYQPFTALVSVPFFYTSNVGLSHQNVRSDFITAPQESVTYVPHITRNLYADIAVQDSYFAYARSSELDFNSLDLRAGLDYIFTECHNLIVRGYYDFNRLDSKGSFQDFDNHSFNFGAEMPFRFGQAEQISIGTAANISAAGTPDLARRDQYDFYVGYDINLTRAFSIDAVERLSVRDYVHGNRVDVSEITVLSANYRFNKYFTGSFISTFAANDSNHDTFDYGVLNVGGALSLSVKF